MSVWWTGALRVLFDVLYDDECVCVWWTGALRVLFDVLYDDELVSEESFMQWRDKSHDGEQTGRGVAILSVDQFYKWLEEDTIS